MRPQKKDEGASMGAARGWKWLPWEPRCKGSQPCTEQGERAPGRGNSRDKGLEADRVQHIGVTHKRLSRRDCRRGSPTGRRQSREGSLFLAGDGMSGTVTRRQHACTGREGDREAAPGSHEIQVLVPALFPLAL